MGKNERQAYLKAIRSRYRNAGNKAKVTILDEFCAICEYHRKYTIRLLNLPGEPRKKQRAGRKPVNASLRLLMAACSNRQHQGATVRFLTKNRHSYLL